MVVPQKHYEVLKLNIKTIKNNRSLVGNAGEHYVIAELLKRNIIAALTPRNTPSFDILATNRDKTINIRVKTKSSACDNWQWNAKKDGSIFQDVKDTNDFTVLVNLSENTLDTVFYIISTPILNKLLTDDYNAWAQGFSKQGKKHDSVSRYRTLSQK